MPRSPDDAPSPRPARKRRPAAVTVAEPTPVQAGLPALRRDTALAPLPAPDAPLGAEAFRAVDKMAQAQLAALTGGLSPAAMTLALFDWSMHLAAAPGKQMELATKAARKTGRFASQALAEATGAEQPPCITPLPGDHRFQGEGWNRPPFSLMAEGFLLTQQWWHNATHEVPGLAPHHRDVVSYAVRQALDMAAPSNLPFTNPEVIARTLQTGGANLVAGWRNWLEDAARTARGEPEQGTEAYLPGRDVAITPGKVVFRNHLIELIQYSPSTDQVRAEPVLIVPAWIMKYYILDLSPQNSLIRYLVAAGHTVFCISWRNPGPEDRELSFDDYRRLGVLAALDAVESIVPGHKIHAAGYCLGGTLLAITAAAMARAGDARLATITLLAAQTDFTEPGELALFIDDSQMHMLDSVMWTSGQLAGKQMTGAFQMLRTNDLIWSRMVHDYMMGERTPMTDMMAWNADTTRMPYKMHSDYLHRLYLHNELAAGHFMVDGHPAVLQNIDVPIFAIGTETDHVAPWQSVYKLHLLTDTELTFVLTSGGHNAGIISEPGHPHRHYRIRRQLPGDICLSPEEWATGASLREGSWWPGWVEWLAAHSAPTSVAPPPMGNAGAGYAPLEDAPGSYVLQR
ncbi:alpha/beta hydrolase [Frigidibacter sp.]|uniref:PHA/PHB synthase family protein n=1 Tax=Frigidibacter sp. TaxID=2586418 RepID=UPI00273464B4|nr:alpha/beta fold hydrolase [Frigidibacter sp.]MDP3338688.1 alpha/beta fold hydrolase [Frigidibacter sp.]